jgi:hypothetical protein
MSTSKKAKLGKKTRAKKAVIKKKPAIARTNEAAKQSFDQCVRDLQKIEALLIAVQYAANYDVEFDVADALLSILGQTEKLLLALDQLETVV